LNSKEIQSEIYKARERLASNLGELDYAFTAQGLWKKTKQMVNKFYKDELGQIRIDRVAISAFVALVYLLISKKD
jgi:hypothetical protein